MVTVRGSLDAVIEFVFDKYLLPNGLRFQLTVIEWSTISSAVRTDADVRSRGNIHRGDVVGPLLGPEQVLSSSTVKRGKT